MSKEGFLQKAGSVNPYISESKILKGISEKNKAIVFVTKDLEVFQKKCLEVFSLIDEAKQSDLTLIKINDDSSVTNRRLASKTIDETQLINLINECFREYKGYCFVVNSGVEFLYKNGEINTDVQSCLMKTKKMQEKLDILRPVSELKKVLNHFKVDCNGNNKYYNKCFDTTCNKVLGSIKEQELRNILLEYLLKNMKGEVGVEFCTDYHNDEESVDIYVNDGIERAIIEVKFSLPAKYYLGKTHYTITKRIEDGYLQLDKYAKHLSKDGRMVEYAYLYMFYINDKDETELALMLESFISKIVVTVDLKSVFHGVMLNDMKRWIVT